MKDIKPDNVGAERPEHIAPSRAIRLFFQRQSISLRLIAAGSVLTVFVVVFYTIKTNRDNEQSSRILGVARTTEQFEELIRQYPKSAAGPVALLAVASSYFSAGAYDEASERYLKFIEKYPGHLMLGAAELGRVMCTEARGEMEKALMEFNAFLLTYPDHFLTPQALFGKARCLHSTGRSAEARVVYENFIAAHPDSKWRLIAEAALLSLDRQMRLQRAAGQENHLQK